MSHVVRELRDSAVHVTYLVGPRGVEYREESSGDRVWYVYDGLGSVVCEVDPDGTVLASHAYDVYGGIRSSAGSSESTHRFCGGLGHATESETGGLIYMRARYYDPTIGRFISEDPAKDGANWYSYCRGNPVNARDFGGRSSELLNRALDILGTIVSAPVIAVIYRKLAHAPVASLLSSLTEVSDKLIVGGSMRFAAGKEMVNAGRVISDAGSEFIGGLMILDGYNVLQSGLRDMIAGWTLKATVVVFALTDEGLAAAGDAVLGRLGL